VHVRALDAASVDRAREWASRLGLPVGTGAPGGLELRLAAGAPASLGFAGDSRRGAVLALPRRRRTAGSDPLWRAVGVGRGVGTVLDATAGLGRDAALLAAGGAQVTMVERHPVLVALLEDALEHSPTPGLQLWIGDARDLLRSPDSADRFDAVYLDPMFPHRDKAALPRNEGQILRALLGEGSAANPEDAELLRLARARATRRVVVKRARRAPPLDATRADHVVTGTRIRFDVYLPDRPRPA
jgi:16S rRNA (guanine1516-N2)-methyltransferase